MTRDEVVEAYVHHFNPVLARMLDAGGIPLEVRGAGCRVFDETGKEFLDFAAGFGVFHVGHGHPRVRAAALEQAAKATTAPPGMEHPGLRRLRDRLSEVLPGDLGWALFAGSGSEALELARRVVHLLHPGRRVLVAAEKSYHGKTLGALEVLGQPHLRRPFEPTGAQVRFLPYGDVAAARAEIREDVAAVFLEPVLGGGYLQVPPPGYLAAVRRRCDEVGALLVVDEVQTGFGRTGRMFAVDADGVVPDIVLLSKGLTGGHVSLAAAVVRTPLAERLAGGPSEAWLREGTTAAATPLACAVACASLDVIEGEGLPARAAELGPHLLGKLEAVSRRSPALVLEAVGVGLMTGAKLRGAVMESACWLNLVRRGVMVGFSTNERAVRPVMRFFPPLVVTREEIDHAVGRFEETVQHLSRRPAWFYDALNTLNQAQFRMPASMLRLFCDHAIS